MSVRILITGGTFDKEYDEIDGRLHFRETHMEEMLSMGRCHLRVAIEQLMLVDSLEMTPAQRLSILEACLRASENQILITHGTDTMVETARLLAGKLRGKTVVLTGAMIPIAFGSSDGLFNVGGALTAVQTLPEGIYIVMNGRIFPWDRVRKNRETGIFEAIPS